MATYMIYQRKMSEELSNRINAYPKSVVARAYFALGMPNKDNVEDVVEDAIHHGFYEPTMIMYTEDPSDGSGRTPFEAIFDEGNGYGDGSITTVNIRKHPSMSVGDLVIDLTNDQAHVCMPTGWYNLELTLELNKA